MLPFILSLFLFSRFLGTGAFCCRSRTTLELIFSSGDRVDLCAVHSDTTWAQHPSHAATGLTLRGWALEKNSQCPQSEIARQRSAAGSRNDPHEVVIRGIVISLASPSKSWQRPPPHSFSKSQRTLWPLLVFFPWNFQIDASYAKKKKVYRRPRQRWESNTNWAPQDSSLLVADIFTS
jgi:hypothetical protein